MVASPPAAKTVFPPVTRGGNNSEHADIVFLTLLGPFLLRIPKKTLPPVPLLSIQLRSRRMPSCTAFALLANLGGF